MKKYLIFALTIIFAVGMFSYAQAAEEVVEVVSFAGSAKVIPAGETRAVPCRPGMRIKEGSQVMTGAESYVEIALNVAKTNIVKVKANSKVVLKLEEPDHIELIDGEIFTLLQALEKGETFRVKTPCATCGARGTGWKTKTDGKVTDVSVFDGRVYVRGINKDGTVMEKKYLVRKGFERKIKKFERPAKMTRISKDRVEKMRKEIRRPKPVKKKSTPKKK